LRGTEIGGFQDISPKKAQFTAFGGYKGARRGLVAATYNPSTYGNVSSSTPETDLNAMHLEAIRSLAEN